MYSYRAGCAPFKRAVCGSPQPLLWVGEPLPPTPGTRHVLVDPAGGLLSGASGRLPFPRRVRFGLKVPERQQQ